MKMTLMEAYGVMFANLVINHVYTIDQVPKAYREATEKEIAKRETGKAY